jgi:hypothetical protein
MTHMNGKNGQQLAKTSWSSADLIGIALRLASDDSIESVHVVTSDRPTYPELLHFRQQATARDLNLGVTGSSVSLKKRHHLSATGDEGWPVGALHAWGERLRERALAREAAAEGLGPSFSPVDSWRPHPVWHWLHAHGQAWRANLAAMSEGTR